MSILSKTSWLVVCAIAIAWPIACLAAIRVLPSLVLWFVMGTSAAQNGGFARSGSGGLTAIGFGPTWLSYVVVGAPSLLLIAARIRAQRWASSH